MPESGQTLNQKTSELQAALDEVQGELARADATRRTEAHDRLADTAREAREWLEARRAAGDRDGPDAAAEVRRAEGLLHQLRMRRDEI